MWTRPGKSNPFGEALRETDPMVDEGEFWNDDARDGVLSAKGAVSYQPGAALEDLVHPK
jgi:hypothetical protein